MTRFDPSLFVKRLIIARGGARVYDELFHLGVNIIRGEKNAVGKSTIANAIFYALGGEGVTWVDEALLCDSVTIEVAVNGVAITLHREISQSKERPMRFFWGSFETATAGDPTAWQIFPFAARGASQSFSQVLFRAMGIPEVKGDLASRLTMHQLLRLMFADQETPSAEMYRQEPLFSSKDTLDAVGSLLCGVYDDRIYEISSELRAKQTEKDELSGQLTVLWRLLQTTDQIEGLTRLLEQVKEREKDRASLYASIEDLRSGRWDNSDDVKHKRLQALAKQVEEINSQVVSMDRELSNLLFEIDDSAQFLTALNDNNGALSDSSATREALGEIMFGYCPACFNDIAEKVEGVCTLCKSPVEKKMADARMLRIRQELSLQIEESSRLQEKRIKRQGELLLVLPTLRSKQASLALQYNELASSVTSNKDDAISQAYERLGYVSREIEDLQQQVELARSLDALENRKSTLVSEMSRLTDEYQRRVASRDEKQTQAYAEIKEIVAYVLNHDEDNGPVEGKFKSAEPEDIDFSFRNNTVTVGGRRNFSASSMVILKNAFHLALVLASTRKDFFRYPRFALFDDIEDKGMTNPRSHNFQRLLVSLSDSAKVEHQIIFTTSVVDPTLNIPQYTVGEYYTTQSKSLKINSGLN